MKIIDLEQKRKEEREEKKEDGKTPSEQPKVSREGILGVLDKINNILMRNIGWKIMALLFAFLVWMSIMNIDDPYITVTVSNIPVTVLNENALEEQGKISDIESGRYVTVKAKAPRSVADNLSARDFVAVADYRQMSLVYAVPIRVSVNPDSSYAREDISIETKDPEMMTLTLEDYGTETFRVDIITEGEAAEGYYIADMVVKPNLIQIAGSVKQIDRIEKVVVPLNTDQVSESFRTTAGMKLYDKNGYEIEENTVEMETAEVEIEVTVLPVKSILLLISIEGTPRFGYECTGTQHVPTEITIAGTPEDLASIYSMTIPFDISMQDDVVESKVNIESYLAEYYGGKYVLVDEEKYVTVQANIEKLPTVDIRVSNSDIEVRNLSENYHVAFTNKSDINIKAWGREEELAQLTAAALKLYIDLEDYEPGTYFVSVYSDTDILIREGTIGIEITDVQDTFQIIEGEEEGGEGEGKEEDGNEFGGNGEDGSEFGGIGEDGSEFGRNGEDGNESGGNEQDGKEEDAGAEENANHAGA